MKFKNAGNLVLLAMLVCTAWAQAQEFNFTVTVNTLNVSQPNQPIFQTLQRDMQDFINNTKWSDVTYKDGELIQGSLVFVVDSYDNDSFRGNWQLAVSRPVHGSSYTTQIFNYKDNDIVFDYVEGAPFFYNKNQFENNLLSMVTFYAYTMLGIDADTFSLKGGEDYHREAQRISNLAQANTRAPGWNPNEGLVSRYRLNDDMLSDAFKEYREVMYSYHREGLDTMAQDQKTAKESIKKFLLNLRELNNRRPNSNLMRTFFDSKTEEIASIFSDGPSIQIADLKNALLQLAPSRSAKWVAIKV